MKFAFDVDGVITDSPQFFSILSHALTKAGHEIFILTDFDEEYREQRIKELKEYGIEYKELIITKNKEKFCLENEISFAIDDDPFDYFPNSQSTSLSIIKVLDVR